MLRAVRRSVLVVLLAVSLATLAQADGPIAHEYVPDVREEEIPSLVTFGGGGDEAPAAIVYDGQIIPAPAGGELRGDEAAMTARPGTNANQHEAGRRAPTYRPDRTTSLEGTLDYYTVFTPSIAPFKRVTSLDMVSLSHGTPVIGVSSLDTVEVPVSGLEEAPPDDRPRDRFWGSVFIDFSRGRRVPFPSVSPESRILTLQTQPEARIRIEKDSADNFYAHRIGGGPTRVRVIFLTDAPRSYFNTELPEIPVDAYAREVAPLPDSLQRRAASFAAELGLTRESSLPVVLRRLTEHFRSFEESDVPPVDTGDIYLDLARAQLGVCRHRAYGFVITAHALGLPARFVHNEAHAWVEVKLGSVGWMRIDLGGAANGLNTHRGEDRPVYRARTRDPLPRPEPYVRAYERARANTTGLPAAALGSPGGPVSEEPGQQGAGLGAPAADQPAAEPAPVSMPEEAGARRPIVLTVERQHFDVYRGRNVDISGRATELGAEGASGLRIEVHITRGGFDRLLGVTVTDDNGWFRGTFGVPSDQPVGDYRLLIRSPGDARHLPATAH